jgi:SAM-dependent methyltransferase
MIRRAAIAISDRLLRQAGRSLSTQNVQRMLLTLMRGRLAELDPVEALRFLFHLDKEIYSLEGVQAVSYGGGTHTKHRHTGYHDFFVSRIGKEDRVLDVGCGNGALSHDIAVRSGAEVLALDLSTESIIEASGRYPHPRVTYLAGNIMEEPVPGTFDVVVLSNVLEHVADRAGFLARIRETAGPSRWLIRVPLFERDWRVPLRMELGMEWRLDPTHETEYTKRPLRGDEKGGAGDPPQRDEMGRDLAEAVLERGRLISMGAE